MKRTQALDEEAVRARGARVRRHLPAVTSSAVQLLAFHVGRGPEAIAFDGTNIWVANRSTTGHEALRQRSAREPDRPRRPAAVALAFDGAKRLVANLFSNT
jgi:hypothetical protein